MPTPTSGLCWRCNYPLHSAFERKCPECGRPFDPADARTMNMGPPIGRLKRFLVSPTGWPTILFALLATAALFYVTGLPMLILRRGTDELTYLMNVTRWKAWYEKPAALSRVEWITLGCIVAWVLIVLLCAFRWLVRGWVLLRHGRCFDLTKARRSRLILVPLLFTATLFLLLYGWPNRVAEGWAHRQAAAWTQIAVGSATWDYFAPGGTPSSLGYSPTKSGDFVAPLELDLPLDERAKLIRHGVEHLRSQRLRTAALSLLVDLEPAKLPDELVRWIGVETDPPMLATMVRLLSLCRRESDIAVIAVLLDHADEDVRSAAADAISVIHAPYLLPAYDPFYIPFQPPVMLTDPPIAIAILFPVTQEGAYYLVFNPWNIPGKKITLPVVSLARLRSMMQTGATLQERQAAARAVLGFPPEDYTLRIAEWGVWLADGNELKLTQSVIDEIPPFVHRTGDAYAPFSERLIYPSVVTKPILHVYASEPMVIDVKVLIRLGRPWFAYPMPDDFQVSVKDGYHGKAYTGPELPAFDGGVAGTLHAPAEGYPWLSPSHAKVVAGGNGGSMDIMHMGLRWQSVVITPARPQGIELADVGEDERFAWWSRLREVKSDYVTSRGETERFLYYDGPTKTRPAVAVVMKDGRLNVTANSDDDLGMERKFFDHPPNPPEPKGHAALFIHVGASGATGRRIDLPAKLEHSEPLSPQPLADPPQVRAALLAMLTDAKIEGGGLTEDEANGLIDAWAPHLFKSPGRRLLLRMTRGEYDRLCPIEITPKPTTLTRVGLILFDLEAAPQK